MANMDYVSMFSLLELNDQKGASSCNDTVWNDKEVEEVLVMISPSQTTDESSEPVVNESTNDSLDVDSQVITSTPNLSTTQLLVHAIQKDHSVSSSSASYHTINTDVVVGAASTNIVGREGYNRPQFDRQRDAGGCNQDRPVCGRGGYNGPQNNRYQQAYNYNQNAPGCGMMQHHCNMQYGYIPFMPPYEHAIWLLHDRLIHQINYYFSHENLVRDIYLRGHMDDEGWVPLRVIANFPRVSKLTRDFKIIANALRKSNEVQIKFFVPEYKIRKRHNWGRYIIRAIN